MVISIYLIVIIGPIALGSEPNEGVKPTTEDVYLLAASNDIGTLSFALTLLDPSTENGKLLQETLVSMIEGKLVDLRLFLPNTHNEQVVSIVCDSLSSSAEDLATATIKPYENFCVALNEIRKYCVNQGFLEHKAHELCLD